MSSMMELERLKELVAEMERRRETSGVAKWFVPGSKMTTPSGFTHPAGIESYPRHKLFFDLGRENRERVFLCANRFGKSVAGAFETGCHLTGLYPDWWTGRRFDKPVKFWVAGKDKTTTRDTLQKELFGSINAFGTGMIPAEMIDRTWSMQGVPAGIELANIKHVSGGLSQVGFKSYDRGVDSFFGTAMDGIWLDEECPEDVYGECHTQFNFFFLQVGNGFQLH